jgi:hypothetical protein
MQKFATAAALALGALLPLQALAQEAPVKGVVENDISGTYKLVVEQRKIVETGEIVPVPSPLGYIT